MTKQELRRHIREAKAAYSASQLADMSAAVCRALMSDHHWVDSRTVLFYHALPDEVDLSPLLSWPKRILLPVVAGDDLRIRRYEGERRLRTGPYGIKEPVGMEFTDYSAIDLVLVPGMAFDRLGNRLGRGRGYYDRLLPLLTHAYRLAVCFPFQLVDKVPSEPHDQFMDYVLTVSPTASQPR